MPHRRLIQHIRNHPWRLAVTLFVLAALSWSVAVYAIVRTVDAAHQGRIDNCVAINELSRKMYVTLIDLGFSPFEVRKFRPTTHCEDIP